MKKLQVVSLMCALLVMGLTVQAKNNITTKLSRRLEAARLQAITNGSHDNAVVDMVLKVESKWANPLNEYSARPMVKEKPCSAVRIDKNWLMASLTCRGIGHLATAYDHNGNAYDKEVAYRKILGAKIRSKYMHARDEIAPKDIFVNEEAQIILLRLNLSDEDLADEVSEVISANLFIPNNPAIFNDTKGFINRESYCTPGRCSAKVNIKQYCAGERCYQIEWKMISGDAGDPLFALVDAREFLVGFNKAAIVGENPNTSSLYRAFGASTETALRNIIGVKDPAAWKRISKNMEY